MGGDPARREGLRYLASTVLGKRRLSARVDHTRKNGFDSLFVRLALLLAGLTSGCSKSTATEVVVILHAEPELLAQSKSVQVTVRDDEGAITLDGPKTIVPGEASIAHVPLIPKGNNPSRRFALTAKLLDATGTELAHVEARSGYVAGELRELHIWFDDACRGISCEAGRTCQGGTCAGSCFGAEPVGATTRSNTVCGECETCQAACVAHSGLPCGCPAEKCSAGTCVPNPDKIVRHVATGQDHTCAALATGAVYCWGLNEFDKDGGTNAGTGQLGIGAGTPKVVPTPTLVEGANGWRSVAAGVHHTCAVDEGYGRTCWGQNYKGELGGPSPLGFQPTPVDAPARSPALDAVVSGNAHSCGLRAQTELFCWGSNAFGNTGVDVKTAPVYEPQSIGTGYSFVAAGGDHTCAIADGKVACWGFNDSSELGASGPSSSAPLHAGCESSNSPTACFKDYEQLGLGWYHSCGIRKGGALYCWGGNYNGQLGFPSPTANMNHPDPKPVAPQIAWSGVAGGHSHTCAFDVHGTLYCWGLNDNHQLGFDSTGIVSTPTQVDTAVPSSFVLLALGDAHSCAVRADRTLWCWGKNVSGQIGIKTASDTPVRRPKRVCF